MGLDSLSFLDRALCIRPANLPSLLEQEINSAERPAKPDGTRPMFLICGLAYVIQPFASLSILLKGAVTMEGQILRVFAETVIGGAEPAALISPIINH